MLIVPLIVAASVQRRRREDETFRMPSLEAMRAAERINAQNDADTVRFLVTWGLGTAIAVAVLLAILSFFFPIH